MTNITASLISHFVMDVVKVYGNSRPRAGRAYFAIIVSIERISECLILFINYLLNIIAMIYNICHNSIYVFHGAMHRSLHVLYAIIIVCNANSTRLKH